MKSNTPWQTATIIGSIWGAFEIVVGSLIHNLAIPMVAGTILSMLGVVIMVSGAKVLGGKGIFWRSALVCAALKTVSPSAVILSPMLGITLEGLLLELGVLILGNNLAGYILGGGLAVLSILGFKLVRLIMIYGVELVDAYKSVFSVAFSNNYLNENGYLIPVAVIVIVYLLIGAIAAFTGYRGGISISKQLDQRNFIIEEHKNYRQTPIKDGYKGGISYLIFHIIWLIAFIGLKDFLPTSIWLSSGIVYVFLCLFRYGRVRALLSKHTFWLVIVVVSIISSFFIMIGKGNSNPIIPLVITLSFTILIRATVVLIAFSCIGIEAMSKGVSRFFRWKKLIPVAQSYAQANEIIPKFISILKANTHKLHKPVPIIGMMYSHLGSEQYNNTRRYPIVIVTGDKNAGKTTFIKEMIVFLENEKMPVAGFIAEGLWDSNNQRSGFNLVTLPNKLNIPLCDRVTINWVKYGNFYFNPQAIEIGNSHIINAPLGAIVFIDEIGYFELEGDIWANALSEIIARNQNPVIITVRHSIVNEVKLKWNLSNVVVFDATSDCPEDIKSIVKK